MNIIHFYSHQAALRAKKLSYAESQVVTNCWISISVVNKPSDTLIAELEMLVSYPIDFKTRPDFTFPDEHADPADMANPAKSICITCVSPFQPGAEKHDVFGSLETSVPM
jgi:hypothetical protein